MATGEYGITAPEKATSDDVISEESCWIQVSAPDIITLLTSKVANHFLRPPESIAMAIERPYYPIIYIRGYAATMSEIEATVATPYMGFNLGSTKIRQDHEGDIVPFVFESPLIRLMKDHDYQDTYLDGSRLGTSKMPRSGQLVSPRSVWIFRYYEPVSESLGSGERQTIPEFAEELRQFILDIRDLVCGTDPNDEEQQKERDRFRVYLVAHSMGGLVARCYLQSICVEGVVGGNDVDQRNAKLELTNLTERRADDASAVHLVDKAFTYATPHNGIDVGDINAPNLGVLDGIHVRNFNREVMRDYLNLPTRSERVDSLNGSFDASRFFCFVGSNYQDYEAFAKLSRRAMGPMSDGLVMIRNATVARAPRAFAHRSHSGHYGIVNSEEGYQQLRRFLFGNVRVDARLNCHEITLPEPIQNMKDDGKQIRASYNIETTARVRGALYALHERKVDQSSAILRTYDQLIDSDRTEYLFSGYLMRDLITKQEESEEMRFALRVSIGVPLFEVDRRFWFDDHIEGADFLDTELTFSLRFGDGDTETSVRYGMTPQDPVGEADHELKPEELEDGRLKYTIPIGFKERARTKPQPGFCGELILYASPWNLDG